MIDVALNGGTKVLSSPTYSSSSTVPVMIVPSGPVLCHVPVLILYSPSQLTLFKSADGWFFPVAKIG